MTNPRYNSYGEFRNSDIFKALFRGEDCFNAQQEKAADDIVDHILRHCNGKHSFPLIKTVIDFGCGDGTLLKAIKAKLDIETKKINDEIDKNKKICAKRDTGKMKINEETDKPIGSTEHWNIEYIGIDLCRNMIDLANNDNNLDDNIIFGSCTTPQSFLHTALLKEKVKDWSTTALLCLGHTWFHMQDQKILIDQIGKERPALLLVDVFKTWDDVVDELNELCDKFTQKKHSDITLETIIPAGETVPLELLPVYVDEETRALPDYVDENRHENSELTVYSLRTQFIKSSTGKPKEIVRGIHVSPPNRENGYWLFASHQIAKSTEALRPTSRTLNASNYTDTVASFKTIAELGEITGGKDYLVLSEFEHVSGWGNMHCIVFAALSPEAKVLNEAYLNAVSGLVNYLFVEPAGKNSAIYNLQSMLRIFGSGEEATGEVAVIMPFDPLRSFLRMVPLNAKQVPQKSESTDTVELPPISKVDLIMEQPNKCQQRFPTAYSLYHSMLYLVSSPIGFPLNKVPDYKKALVDEMYEKLEAEFLGVSEDDFESSYFLIPFYFGSLPLFSLILQEPKDFPMGGTNAQLYFSLAQNLDRQVHVAVEEILIQNRVIVPFVVGALDGLKALKCDQNEIPNKISDKIKLVTGKPWKSWVAALPSHPLAYLDSTTVQNKTLNDIVDFELKRIMNDVISQISVVFQSVELFASNGQDERSHIGFVCDPHIDRLNKLKDNILCNKPLVESDYFINLKNYPKNLNVLKFADELINDMLLPPLQQEYCKENNYGKKCNVSHNSRNIAFLLAKRVFCRMLGNTGQQFRFSFSRLFAVIIASCGGGIGELKWSKDDNNPDRKKISITSIVTDDKTKTPWKTFKEVWCSLYDWEVEAYGKTLELGTRAVINEENMDVIAEIEECLSFLNELKPSSVSLTCENNEELDTGKMTIIVETSELFKRDTGGNGCRPFLELADKHHYILDTNRNTWQFTVYVRNLNDRLDVSWDVE